ncbi:MAG: hypothetical protein HRU28_11075 [Rhizobiales bacterium]|nr:hypothetical protein [Hyphomicrobiales bacterium]
MNKIILSTLAVVPILLAISFNPGNAVAAGYSLKDVGGINLNYYCKKTYGSAFKAKLLKRKATGWICEQSEGNRRPIIAEAACIYNMENLYPLLNTQM